MKILKWVWQLPQNCAGLALTKIIKSKSSNKIKGLFLVAIKEVDVKDRVICVSRLKSGLSLGKYIFIPEDNFALYKRTLLHELGHSVQSVYFGPLYLIVVGIPSICLNLLSRISPTVRSRYYEFWPENQADKLGKQFQKGN
jgi:hypothetical protein